MTQRDLERQATKLLRQSGHTWSGRKRGAVSGNQVRFETRMVKTGFRGASRPAK